MNEVEMLDCAVIGGRPAVSGAPGLFVAGAWVAQEALLADAALASARRAAHLAEQYVRAAAPVVAAHRVPSVATGAR